MVTEQTLGEEQVPPVGPDGADQSEEFADDTGKQLFGDESTPSKGEASKGESEGGPELPLEAIQSHPAFSDLQRRHDRQGNVIKFQKEQIGTLSKQLEVFRGNQAAELLERLGGDTPENRETVEKITKGEELYGQALEIMELYGPILKEERAKEILAEEQLPIDYLPDLVACETLEDAVRMAKNFKTALAKSQGATQSPGQKTSGPQKQPAMGHKPDKAQGSVAPQSFEQAQDAYIRGDIDWTQYKAAADKAGIPVQ